MKNIYIIKNLGSWMTDELLVFLEATNFEVIILRNPNDFAKKEIELLIQKGVNVSIKPFSWNKIIPKLKVVIYFILSNIHRFSLDYNFILGAKSIYWFLKIDIEKFSTNSNIHAQFATQSSLVSILIKKYYKNQPSFSFTFHAHDIYFKNRWFKLMMKECQVAFSISDFNIAYVKREYKVTKKVVLSRLGVYRRDTSTKLNFERKNDNFLTIGLLSWFVEKKGIKYLLSAMKELTIENKVSIKLVMAGDGPLKKDYIDFIDKNELNKSIELIGKVSGQEKIEFFQSLDAFILPSISIKNDMDGIPVVLMEAIAYNLPIISTDVSGIPEICKNDYNGLLISEKNILEIKNAIKSIYLNDASRIRFIKNSVSMSMKYDIEINSKTKLKQMKWV